MTRPTFDRTPRTPVSRRSFLAAGAASAAALSLPTRAATRGHRQGSVRNLIFLVSDGMSTGTLTLADLMIRELEGRPSHWCALFEREGVRRSMVRTASANSMVTDSAAASTAWGIGEIVKNGAIGTTPDMRMPEPLLHRAKRAGKATGLVTTATVSHATPAGWACNVPTGRADEPAIARQMIERGYDLLLGGGRRFFTDEKIALRPQSLTVFSREELLAAPRSLGSPLVGVFSDSHMSYELDRPETQPHIAEMTRVAIERLSLHPDGFVLQIEGGRIDHAAHANDAGSLVHEQMAFDEALGVAIAFAEHRDDTLVIATTDHANGNPGLTEYLSAGRTNFLRIAEWRHSFEWMTDQFQRTDSSPESVRAIIAEATSIVLDEDEMDTVMRWRLGERLIPFRGQDKGYGPLGSVLANHNGVSFISGNHTADHVELTAFGPGAETVPPVQHLSDMHHVIARLLDLPPALPSL
ncbi:MAG: alkaline phosphatase [Planctomycetota bacterium]|nr:MAG: alkaline phosphatase [Planctomycetota bacterium]